MSAASLFAVFAETDRPVGAKGDTPSAGPGIERNRLEGGTTGNSFTATDGVAAGNMPPDRKDMLDLTLMVALRLVIP